MRSLEDFLPPTPPTVMRSPGELERVVVRTADGRVFDLGSPASRLFRLRVWVYRLRRRSEFRHG